MSDNNYFFFLISLIFISVIFSENKQYVSKILFEGNSVLTDEQLKTVIKLRSPKLFSRSEFSLKLLNRDIINLMAYYKSNGFLEVDIIGKDESISEKYKNIIFSINEGIQYQLKHLLVYGNKFLSDDHVLNILDVHINDIYNPAYIRKQLKRLKREYLIRGKLDIDLVDEVSIEDRYVTARINISEGVTYKIQNIYIKGLELIKEKYIFREITFKSEGIYDIS